MGPGQRQVTETPVPVIPMAITGLWGSMFSRRTPKIWQRLMQNGMKKDYSWASSAKAYAQIYEDLRKAKA